MLPINTWEVVFLQVSKCAKSLNYYTSKLPLLDSKNDCELIGTNTKKSIQSGVINGVISEIDGIIRIYYEFDDLTVVLTGGDSEFLSIRLKNSIFANSNFLLEGLITFYNLT